MEKAPGALEKLKAKGGDLSKITMPELESLAFRFFGGAMLKSKNKGPMVAEVRGLVVKHRAANPLGLSDESLSNALCDEEDSPDVS